MVRPQLFITKDHVVGKATIFVIGQYYCFDGLNQIYSLLTLSDETLREPRSARIPESLLHPVVGDLLLYLVVHIGFYHRTLP